MAKLSVNIFFTQGVCYFVQRFQYTEPKRETSIDKLHCKLPINLINNHATYRISVWRQRFLTIMESNSGAFIKSYLPHNHTTYSDPIFPNIVRIKGKSVPGIKSTLQHIHKIYDNKLVSCD